MSILDEETKETMRHAVRKHAACPLTQGQAKLSTEYKAGLAAMGDATDHLAAAAIYETVVASVAIDLPKRDLLDTISRLYDELLWHDQASEKTHHQQPREMQ